MALQSKNDGRIFSVRNNGGLKHFTGGDIYYAALRISRDDTEKKIENEIRTNRQKLRDKKIAATKFQGFSVRQQ